MMEIEEAEERIRELSNEIAHKYERRDLGDIYHEEMTEDEKLIFATCWFETEVENGGFHQYLLNGTGAIAADTYNQFMRIGAVKTAALLKTALDFFPQSMPARDQQTRMQQLLELPRPKVDEIMGLTDKYFTSKEHPSQLAMFYIDPDAE